MPDFSVIVPVYKVEPFLRECVDSILAQTHRDFELLLVDDGSPDNSGAICDEYAQKDDRVVVIHQPNRGVTVARKVGLDHARSEYICFVDADDSVKSTWLQTIYTAISENGRPDIILFGFIHDFHEGDGEKEYPPIPQTGYYDRARLEKEIYPYMLWDRRGPFYSRLFQGYLCTKVFRRQVLLDHFLQDPRIKMYEDVSMLFSCFGGARDLYVCPECLYTYRWRSDSASKYRSSGYLSNLRLCLEYMNAHLGRELPVTLPQINAYCLMRTYCYMDSCLKSGTFRSAVRLLRQEMHTSGLARLLRARGLTYQLWILTILFKLHLYMPAVFLTKLRPIPEAKN